LNRVPYDVMQLRKSEFWAGETTYLDHAAIGPLPERTRLACDEMNLRRSRPYELAHDFLFGALAAARVEAAALIGADPGEIALTTNTSFGLGMAARALPFERGDVVLASDREFPANVYPWKRLGDKGVTLELVPCTREGVAGRGASPRAPGGSQAVRRRPAHPVLERLHRRSRPPLRRDLPAASSWWSMRSRRLAGPVDVAATPVDVLACGGRSGCLSVGSGFVHVRRELIPASTPRSPGGWPRGTDDFTRLTNTEYSCA
jgi:selenocysteine lyase/cysteine desulfurase